MFSQKVNGKQGIYFCYTAQWLIEPYYKSTDLIGIVVDNGRIVNTNQYPLKANCSYTLNVVTYNLFSKSESKSKQKNNISPYWKYFGSSSGVAYVQDLPGEGGIKEETSRALARRNYGSTCEYDDITYTVYGYATKSSSAMSEMCINAYYGHEESTVTVKPSCSLSGKTIEFSLSPSVEKKIVWMGDGLSGYVNQYK